MTFYSWTPYRHQAPLNYRGVCPAEGAGNPAPALDPRWLPTEAPLLPLPSVLCGRPNPPALRHFRLSRCHGAGLLNGSRGAEPPDGGRPLGARLVGSGDNGGCGARGPVVAPDGSGRPRRERAGLKRRRRRPGAGRRSGREAEGGPPAGRARGRLRGAGAGARAGSRGGYDDPATGPRISSSPPPPHGSPSSRLRTRPTGGESDRAGRRLGGERAPIRFPRRGRAGRGLSGAPGLRGAPRWARPHPGPGAQSCGPAARGPGGACVPGKAGRLRACFQGNSPCLLPLLFGACCCPQMTGGRLAPPHPAGFFPGRRGRFPACGLCVCISQLCLSPWFWVICALCDQEAVSGKDGGGGVGVEAFLSSPLLFFNR